MCLKFIKGKMKKVVAFSLALLMAGVCVAPAAYAETTKGYVGKEVKITHESKDRFVANATFYDYYSDSQVGAGKEPLEITDALKSASYVETKAVNTFQKFNNQLLKTMNYGNPDKTPTKTPLYQGYFVNFMGEKATGGIFSTIKPSVNKASGFDMSAHGGITKCFVKQGLVDNRLSTDSKGSTYITTSNSKNGKTAKLPYFDKEYLTTTTFENSELTLGSVKEKVSFPFRQQQVKNVTYYEFDSSKDVVRFNDDGELEYKGTKASEQVKDAKGKAGFFPYNNPSDSKSNKLNFGFGTKIEIPFTTTKNGKINGQDIIFEFKGDDDVWVFIDGEMAIDLGGSHNQVSGRLNMKTMQVSVTGKPVKKVSDTVRTKLKDTTKAHTLTFYYMERGEWQSNMKIRFNLPEPNNMTVVNEVKSEAVNKVFLEEAKKVSDDDKFVYGITDKDLNEYDEQVLTDREYVSYTNEFKYNDKMQLKLNGLKDTNRSLKELYNTKYVLSDSRKTISSRKSTEVVDSNLKDTKAFVFRNKDNVLTPFLLASFENQIATGDLEITSSVIGKADKKDKFEYVVVYSNVFGGDSEATYYGGEYTVVDTKGNKTKKTAVEGKVILKANERVIIEGIPTNTKVAVQQVRVDDEYKMDTIDTTDNFEVNKDEAVVSGTIKKNSNEIIFAMNSSIEETKANADKYDNTPSTGDSSKLLFWMINVIAAVGVIGITIIVIYRKKNEE